MTNLLDNTAIVQRENIFPIIHSRHELSYSRMRKLVRPRSAPLSHHILEAGCAAQPLNVSTLTAKTDQELLPHKLTRRRTLPVLYVL